MPEQRHIEPDESGHQQRNLLLQCNRKRLEEIIIVLKPNHFKFEWGEQSTIDPRYLNLLNLNDWLQNEVFRQKIVTSSSDHFFQKPPNTTRPQNSTSRFPSRVHQTTKRTIGKF